MFSFSCRLNVSEFSVLPKIYLLMYSGLFYGSMFETNGSLVSLALIIFYLISKLTYVFSASGSGLTESLSQYSSLCCNVFFVFVLVYLLPILNI